MDFQSIAKVSPKHLPEELFSDILSRLPVKSLLRFCCVSKSWLSMIKDPDFRRLHLQNFKNNHDETHLLVVQGELQHCVVRSSNTFEQNTGTLVTLGMTDGAERWRIKCFIDGLLLVESKKHHLRIWNPSIRKFHDIPTSPEIETYHNFHETVIGLAYDALVEDYKCVKIVHGSSNQPPLVAVYTLGANSWRIIPFQVKEGGSNFLWNFDSIEEPVFLRGNLYFLVDHLEGEVREMGWFDVSSEVFCSISWPVDSTELAEGPIRSVCNGCSSLAWIHNCFDCLTMWVFESKSMCWTQCYENLAVPWYFYLKKNRDTLMWWLSDHEYYSPATRKSLKLDLCLVSSYNLETKQEEILLIQKDEDNAIPELVCGYIESLVLLK